MAAAKKKLNSVNLRLPAALLERAEALAEAAASAPELAILPNVTRSDILRLCLLRGVEALESEYEAVVDEGLAEAVRERMADPENQELIPLSEVRARHGL